MELPINQIIHRLRETDVTLGHLMKEYRCGYATIMCAIRSQISKRQWEVIAKKKMAATGVKTRFQEGHKTWNKNAKGVSFPGSERTQFKKGHLPAGHRHVGSVRLVHRDDRGQAPYREIKVSGIMEGTHKWVSYARYVWEKANGPIPKGYLVFHSNGDRLNDDLENLELVDRRENLVKMKERNPGWKKKAIRTLKKTCAARRKKKAEEDRGIEKAKAKQLRKRQREKEVEIKTKLVMEAELVRLYGPEVDRFECSGCGFEYNQHPRGTCAKCGSIAFERIRQRIATAETGVPVKEQRAGQMALFEK